MKKSLSKRQPKRIVSPSRLVLEKAIAHSDVRKGCLVDEYKAFEDGRPSPNSENMTKVALQPWLLIGLCE